MFKLFKGTVDLKIIIVSLFPHPRVVPGVLDSIDLCMDENIVIYIYIYIYIYI